jgi:hypothetical protein
MYAHFYRGYSNAFDDVCPNFCSQGQPFTCTPCFGHTAFIKLVYDQSVLHVLQHFESQRWASRLDTNGIIVLPRWHSPLCRSWHPILKQYKFIHTHPPAGAYLFHTINNTTDILPVGPTDLHIDIYLADHTVEERQLSAHHDVGRLERIHPYPES